METGIKATFFTLKDARQAFAEMEYLKGPGSRIKLYNLTKRTPKWLRKNTNTNRLAKYTTIGAVAGFIFGFALMLILQQLAAFEYVQDWNIFLFSVPFLVIGLVCSAIFFFIRKEKIVELVPDDVGDDEAVISVHCEADKVSLFEKILKKNHADHIVTA
ncbi:MAG: hypothetical protein CME62_00610 [Halobacteriovoraceae bacterium]|nr:hypothetical protein [Halobacteriovoraceae bacterium]|tara:strand:- start:6058 stop:6534 length:477 start_codon:yes stop_codon:yes gene_type:complete